MVGHSRSIGHGRIGATRTIVCFDVQKEDIGQPQHRRYRSNRNPLSRKRYVRVDVRTRTMPGSLKDLISPTPKPML